MESLKKVFQIESTIITIEGKLSAEQDRCFNCEKKYDLTLTVKDSEYTDTSKEVKKSDLPKTIDYLLDTARFFLFKKEEEKPSNSELQDLIDLGFN